MPDDAVDIVLKMPVMMCRGPRAIDHAARMEDVLLDAKAKGLSEADVNGAIDVILDRGHVYEPILGRFKLAT